MNDVTFLVHRDCDDGACPHRHPGQAGCGCGADTVATLADLTDEELADFAANGTDDQKATIAAWAVKAA
jgi:hypothetical protein